MFQPLSSSWSSEIVTGRSPGLSSMPEFITGVQIYARVLCVRSNGQMAVVSMVEM